LAVFADRAHAGLDEKGRTERHSHPYRRLPVAGIGGALTEVGPLGSSSVAGVARSASGDQEINGLRVAIFGRVAKTLDTAEKLGL
jgi:hypothetical protein